MDFSSLPNYPLPTRTSPEDAQGDIDWGLLFSHLFLCGITVLFLGLMLFALVVAATWGQVLELPSRIAG